MEFKLPGQALENAAGEVASAAGLSIVDAVGHRFKAWNARKSANNEALAIEEKLEIAHQGDRKRKLELEEDRRMEERQELAHQVEMSIQLSRGIQRVNEQIEDEQRRIEWLGVRSTKIANADPDRADARPIDDDWLKRFFRYSAEVDESAILEILARGLADAAIKNRNILSPKALDILRHFEKHSYEMFKFCANEISRFEALPYEMLENRAKKAGYELDISQMIELGLVREDRRKHFSPRFGDLFLTFSYDSGVNSEFRLIQMTYVGRSIASLYDSRIRQLEKALRELSITPKVRELQNNLGLDIAVVTSFSRNLIAQIAETEHLDIEGRDLRNESQDICFRKSRKSRLDPFLIGSIREVEFSDKYTSSLVSALADVFDDFDKNELPYLYTNDIAPET